MVETVPEIGLTRRLAEAECCKNRAQNGAIMAVPVRTEDRRECSDEKSFHNVANRRDGRTMTPFSRRNRKFRLSRVIGKLSVTGAELVLQSR